MSRLVALFDAQKGLLQFIDIFDIESLLEIELATKGICSLLALLRYYFTPGDSATLWRQKSAKQYLKGSLIFFQKECCGGFEPVVVSRSLTSGSLRATMHRSN